LKKLIKFLSVIISLGVLGGLGLLGFFVYISFDLPQISSLADYNPPIPSRILSEDGEVLLEIGLQKREVVDFKDIPKKVINAFLAAEDDNFYQHKGVDYMGLARAMVRNVMAGRIVQGGSTITQQVAKSLLLTREKTITRKVKDFLLAQKIEEKFSKEDILYLYLNQVYLGGGYYGVKAAFRGYFDKDLSDATIAETALIAGLLVAPGRYSPYINPKKAKMRQSYVLKRLHTTGKITDDEYKEALNEKIKIRLKKGIKSKGGHFTDWVRQRLFEKVGKEKFLTGGFEVVTTINWDLQKVAEKQVLEGIQEVDKRQGFKGALKNLDRNQFVDYYKKQRQSTYSENSKYFVFDTDGINKDEIIFSETEIENILENRQKLLDEVDKKRRKKIIPGVLDDDPLISFLNDNVKVKVLVEEVNDDQRVIYASYGGVPIVIPYDGFKWAHERVINEEKKYFPYVKEPSSILKKGDIVLAKIKDKPKGIKSYFNKAYSAKLVKNKKLDKFYKEQKYFVADLDQESNVEGALLSIDPNTGHVLSMVGGADFDKSQFNRVIQSNRQPGSSFKPFIFASSLENGFTPSSLLLDSPSALGGANQALDWKPRNYDGKFKGEMTLRRSLEVSRNIPTIKLVQDVGVDKVIEFSKRIGIDSEMPQDLSISLGSFGINLEKLVKAYSIFPNGGRKVNLKAILSVKDRFGKVYIIDENKDLVEEGKTSEEVKEEIAKVEEVVEVKEGEEKKEGEELVKEKVNEFLVNLAGDQVYDKRLAYIMTNLLKGVVQSGTGARAKGVSSFIGGKTGTTNNYVDAWFMGFSRNVVTGVWVGHDDNKTLGWPETGSKSALPIWVGFMKKAIQKYGESDFEVPGGIVNVAINKETGKPVSVGGDGAFLESFVEGTEPGLKDEEESPDKTPDAADQVIIDDDEYYSSQ
jgi:penicillin-binding protein 1A